MIENGLGFQLVPWSPSLEREWPRLVIVHDIKRENFQLTSGWRDPTNTASAAYNHLLEIRRGVCEVREAQNVCISWLIPKGRSSAATIGKKPAILCSSALSCMSSTLKLTRHLPGLPDSFGPVPPDRGHAESDACEPPQLRDRVHPSSLQQRESCSTRARTSDRACCRPQ